MLLDFVLLDLALLDLVLLDVVFEALAFDVLVFVVAAGLSGVVTTLTAAALDVVVVVVFCAFATVTFEVFVATGFDVAVMEVGMRVDVAFVGPAAFTAVLVAVVEPDAFSMVGVGDAVVDEALVAAPAGLEVPGVGVGTL